MIMWTSIRQQKGFGRLLLGRSVLMPSRVVIAGFIIGMFGACAERRAEPPTATYSSVAAVASANYTVLAAAERVDQSAARVETARAALLPKLALNGSYADSDNDNLGASNSSGSTDTERVVGFRAAVPLFRGFSNLNAVRGAEAERQASEQSFLFRRDEIVVTLVSVIAEVVRDEKAVGIHKSEIADINRFLKEARQRRNAGATSETDLNQIRTRLAAAQAELSQARATLQSSMARRASILRDAGLDSLAILDVKPFLPVSIDEAIETAVANNSSLRELSLRQEATRRNIQVAEGAFLPSVDFSVTGEHNPDRNVTSGLGNEDDLEFRIDINMPLFDGGARRAETLATGSAYREANYVYLNAQRELIATVQSIWARSNAAREVTRYAESRVTAARQAFSGVREGRRIGARSVQNELDARKDVLDAELSLHEARFNQLVAHHQLLLQTGQIITVYGLTD